MARIKSTKGFFDGRVSPEVRASKRAKASAVRLVGGGRPKILAMRDRSNRMSGMESTMLPTVERRLPKCSIRDIIAKKEEWVALNVDSIMPAKERQLSTIDRTNAKAASQSIIEKVLIFIRWEPASMTCRRLFGSSGLGPVVPVP